MTLLQSETIVGRTAWYEYPAVSWAGNLTWELTVVVTSVTGTGAEVELYETDSSGGSQALNRIIGPLGAPGTYTYTGTRGRLDLSHFRLQVHAWWGNGAWSGSLALDAGAAIYCAYGTRAKPLVQASVYLDAPAIVAIAEAVSAIWAVPLLLGLGGLYIYTVDLCSHPAPPLPELTADDFMFGNPNLPGPSAFGKAWSWIQAAAWPTLCECIPGGPGDPPAVERPIVTQPTPPAGIPTHLAPIVCDSGDICAQFNQLMTTLLALQRQLALLRGDVTLIQRQHVPFAYLPGPTHIGLSGSGSFVVQAILGLSVSCTTVPNRLGRNETDAPEYIELGHVSFGTGNGYLEERVVSHNPHVFFDVPGTVTTINYDLVTGVVADLTELVREP